MVQRLCFYGLILIGAAWSWSGPAWAAPPVISSLTFPSTVEQGAAAVGWIAYQDPDQNVVYARFDVADGRYHRRVALAPTMTSVRGRMKFTLRCTPYAQRITLAVRLFDAAGERSAPRQLTFTCGRPPLYDFDAEQARSFPLSRRVPLNVFILDDGETALAEGAAFFGDGLLGEPRSEVRRALQTEVLPKLTGIWDQCGLGFELVGAWVVKPDQLQVAGGSLDRRLFSRRETGRVIHHGRAAGDLLRQATFTLWQAAQAHEPRAAYAFNVLIVGARILTLWNGEPADIEGFSEGAWPNYALVRWGAVLDGVTPKQMIATLAHELGHNLGLGHPGEDGLRGVTSDPMNLMRGSGVSPQPRAHLLKSQCERTGTTLTQLAARLQVQVQVGTPTASPPEGEPAAAASGGGAAVRWLNLCPQNVCSGRVELGVEAEGFPDLESFGFAVFEYSQDGEHFVEIGVDRSPQDGFRALWDTTALPDGSYILRATVTDAQGVRASVQVSVTVRNET